MIIGLLPNAANAETLLNNLAEAGFDLAHVSIIMSDVKTRDALAKDTGPLQGAQAGDLSDRLVRAGLSPAAGQFCGAAVAHGQVLVALTYPPQAHAAAVEMLKDHAAQIVKE